MTYDIVEIDKEEIKVGDTILCEDEKIRTVCRNNITTGFTGKCIFGNPYRLGLEKVKKIINLKF
jgi:hypothetical protein